DRGPMLPGPFSQLQQDDVDPVAVPAKRAARVQQLLKDLIVRRKFDLEGKAEMVAPEFQRILHWLCGEVGGDHQVDCRLFIGRVNAVQQGESDAGEFYIRFARLIENA